MSTIGYVVLFFNVLFLLLNVLGVADKQKPYIENHIFNKNGTYNTALLTIICTINCIYFALRGANVSCFIILYFIMNILLTILLPKKYLKKKDDGLTVLRINTIPNYSASFDGNLYESHRMRYGAACALTILLISLNILALYKTFFVSFFEKVLYYL